MRICVSCCIKCPLETFSQLGHSIQMKWIIYITLIVPTLSFGQGDENHQLSYDYPRIFHYVREILSHKPARKFLKTVFEEELFVDPQEAEEYGFEAEKLSELSETQLFLLLRLNPELWPWIDSYLAQRHRIDGMDETSDEYRQWATKWQKTFRRLIKDDRVREEFRALNDPLSPLTLKTQTGAPGYSNRKLYVGHPHYFRGELLEPDDLQQVWIDFILSAQHQLILNVFDFNLMKVADAIIQRRKAGVELYIGIDDNVIENREQVLAVFEKLQEARVYVVAIDATGLNHQKVAAKDWDHPAEAGVLFSSGNLTQSGLGTEGDLVDIEASKRPKASIPNANHVITMDSHILANMVHHELRKPLILGLRGSEFPLGGAYKVIGEQTNPSEDIDDPFLIVAFTPNGALNSVNTNMISRVLSSTDGSVHMMQFAFSSKAVVNALLVRAKREIERDGIFDFQSVGDGPFALEFWSGFLVMVGLQIQEDEEGRKTYVENEDSEWLQVLGKKDLAELRKKVLVGTGAYEKSRVTIDNVEYEISAKIHHKVLVSGNVVFTGSFNFSSGAENNSEQALVFYDPDLAEHFVGMTRYLAENSKGSVYKEAMLLNKCSEKDRTRE